MKDYINIWLVVVIAGVAAGTIAGLLIFRLTV